MSKVYSKPTQVLCISLWVLHYQWPLCLGPLIFEEHLQTQLEHSAQTPLLLSVHGVPCVVELRMYFGEERLTPLENILFLNNVKLLHHQGFTRCHRATFPPTFSSLPSQPFPFFTLPCSFLSTLKKILFLVTCREVQLFSSADSLPGPWVLPVHLKWLLKSSPRQSAPWSQRCWLVKGAHLCYPWILIYYHQGTGDPLRTGVIRRASSIVSGMAMRTKWDIFLLLLIRPCYW